MIIYFKNQQKQGNQYQSQRQICSSLGQILPIIDQIQPYLGHIQ